MNRGWAGNGGGWVAEGSGFQCGANSRREKKVACGCQLAPCRLIYRTRVISTNQMTFVKKLEIKSKISFAERYRNGIFSLAAIHLEKYFY